MGQDSITLDGRTISYTIKRSPGIKYLRIELRPRTGITVVVPGAFDIGQIPDLLETKKKWILSKLAKCARLQPPPAMAKDGDMLPYLGRDLKLVILRNPGAEDVRMMDDALVVSLRASEDGNLASALVWWYRTQSDQIIKRTAEKLSTKMGLSYNRLIIRGQKTRWASCSQRGNLSFNWKLVMAPEPVIEYVIIHELAHLQEMNHSKQFWTLVAQHCPGWREHKKWLKENERQLNARLQQIIQA